MNEQDDELDIESLKFVDTCKIHEALQELINEELHIVDKRSFRRGLEWAMKIVLKSGIQDDDVICREIRALLKD